MQWLKRAILFCTVTTYHTYAQFIHFSFIHSLLFGGLHALGCQIARAHYHGNKLACQLLASQTEVALSLQLFSPGQP